MRNNLKFVIEKLDRLISQLSYFPQTVQLVWKAAQAWTLLWLFLLTIQGLFPAAIVYLTRLLVDSLVSSINSNGAWDHVQETLKVALIMAALMIVTEFLQTAIEWVRNIQAEYSKDYLHSKIYDQSVSLDLAFYESPNYYDKLLRAREQAGDRSLNLLENGGNVLQGSITLAAMISILIPYGIWLPLILFVSTIPAFYVTMRHGVRYHLWWKKSTTKRRYTKYCDFVLTSKEFATELRLFELGPYFQNEFLSARKILRKDGLKLLKEQSLARLGAGMLAVIISGSCLGWMAWRTIKGSVTLGDLALFYQVFNRGQGLLRTLLGNTSEIYTNSLFLSTLFEFLSLQPGISEPAQPLPIFETIKDGIRFRDISFRYPESNRTALRNFNLQIPAGQTIAIVGENGAGKSTLLKLLCRLYDPDSGSIEIDGVDLRKYSSKELRHTITVMLQKSAEYRAIAKHNISMGNVSQNLSENEIESASKKAGAHDIISGLPDGYNTMLGHWFAGGTQLSGGEWQRIALARSFLRNAQIMILDEPTSFMDSWAEAEWLKRLRTIIKGQTCLIITHRFTTAMKADVIHVMQKGKVIESGNHNDLVTQGGLYAESWKTQIQAQTL